MSIKRNLFFIILLPVFYSTAAQHRVQFIITSLPNYHLKADKIYVAGSFNKWNPADEAFLMESRNNTYILQKDLPPGYHEFKLTRGSWEKTESLEKGFPIENHNFKLESDTIIRISIQHWSDHFPANIKRSTAGSNVRIIDTAFPMTELYGRTRRIWIYLPASYQTSKRKYPVLYMHDGQNLFDDSTSGFGEWGIDEAMDTLGRLFGEMIVVGIDHGGEKRINEYAPYDMEKFGKGEGKEYLAFLRKSLMPYINRNYRTSRKKNDTFIAGSSMGGLISFYAILEYPKTFGGAGVFSPAFWINPQLKDISRRKAKKVKGNIFFYAGQKESDSMVPDMMTVFNEMLRHSKASMRLEVRSEGRHNEATWRKEFPLFYEWLIHHRAGRSRR